ncbi:MAG: peroxiredoxin [Cellulomonadaceae bacterium]|nr:peroxiredoxin [Cellulomonadaceae bacterium]
MSAKAKADPFAKSLKIGDNAPPFTLFSADGKKLVLSNLRKEAERGVIVFFYPKASSTSCTKEACDFRDSLKVFESHGYKVVGISPDTAEDNTAFAAKQKLSFPLATDKGAKTARKYGAWGKVHRYGRAAAILPEQVHPIMPKDDGLLRSTFVVDKAGKIALAWVNVRADGHVARLRKALRIDH